ncbi:MAG: carboxypeptidase-like regulatory domain-containing protein [Edaphobacter sp.]
MAAAQQPTGVVRGSILDATGAVIPGASVTATGADNWPRSIVSGADGTYVLRGLPTGEYIVRAASPGFMQPRAAHVHVSSNSVMLNITLQVAGQQETVTVEGNDRIAIGTDPGQNASATHVTAKGLDSLSNDPDDFVTDIQTLAGPSAGLEGAQVYIDGLTAGDAVLPDKAAVQEIRINQNPFAPEFDSMGLGRVELLTKAGADAYHATAFFNYGDALFNSRNPYAPEKPPFTLKQYGGSVSGPISKKLSFFFDLNKRDIGNGAVINAVTLDPDTLAIVDPYTQVFISPFRFLRISPRVDYKISSKHSLMLRYGYTKNDYDHYGVGSFDLVSRGANAHLREHAVQVTETAILSPKIVSETNFLFLHQYHTHQADATGPHARSRKRLQRRPDPETFSSYLHHHYQVQNITTVGEKNHTIRFGVRLPRRFDGGYVV